MNNEIEINLSIHDRNDRMAAELNRFLTERGVFAVNVMGAPGVGKTSSLVEIIRLLDMPACVVEGDIESDIDTRKLSALGIRAVQINTGGACHLDVPPVSKAVKELTLENSVLFIENIGNLVCPAEFMIGEHVKLLLTNVTEGSDKPFKYPLAFEKADVILLGKIDLLPHVDFDREQYMNGVRKLNADAPVFETSAKTGAGFEEVADWISRKARSFIEKL